MKIGGYIKADFLYDFNGTLDRISDDEDTGRLAVRARLLGFTLALSIPGGATAQEPDSLQAAPDSAVADTMRIYPLRNNAVDLAGDQLAADPFENSWPLFGTGARMAIGGYVKLDYVQDEGRDALASPGISQEERQTSEELHTEGLLRQLSETSSIWKSNPS